MSKSDEKATIQSASRPPIVAVMGHVDHGKTSLLDAIRKTNVAGKEFGGITQHIGAYQVEHSGRKITFIDTPGHEAFSQMRARGGRAADIVILVVSAEEGVKPQTVEALAHARAAKVPIIVAITKIDSPNSNIQKAKQQLADEGLMVEGWGGDVVCCEISSKTGENLEKLLNAILAVADMQNLQASESSEVEAVIIEARMDRKKGIVVSCIVKNGSLNIGDKVTASGSEASVKSLTNDKGENIQHAGPSTPVEILGFKNVPDVGDLIVKKGSELAALSVDENRVEIIGQNTKKTVAIVLKADTKGTLEAVKAGLAALVTSSSISSYSLKFLLASTGDVTDSDVMLASSVKGLVVGFNVRVDSHLEELAESLNVPLKIYRTIYELTEDLKVSLEGAAFDAEAKIKGRAVVVKIFKLPSGDLIAGSKVLAGALKEGAKVLIYDKDPAELKKEDMPLFTGLIKKLKKGKEDVTVVGKDNECGVLFKPQYDDIREGLWLEVK